MNEAVECLCALCVIGAYLEQLHGCGRYWAVIRFAFGLKMIAILLTCLKNIL